MDEQILNFLSQAEEEWIKTLKIAQAVGGKRKSDVNPVLYALESQGKVLKHDGTGPPQWKIAGRGAVIKDTLQSKATETGGGASSGCATTPVTPVTPPTPVTPEPAVPPETACPASDEASTQPLSLETRNVKGLLLERFGKHAVDWKHIPRTSFQCDVQVGLQHSFRGLLASSKVAAEKSAAEKAWAYFLTHPNLMPQVAPAGVDYKSQLDVFSGGHKIKVSYETKQSATGGFESTVSATNQQEKDGSLAAPVVVVKGGRKKIDAEHLAAQAVLEKLHSQVQRSSVERLADAEMTSKESTSELSELSEAEIEILIEAFGQQVKEHVKLKALLKKEPNLKFKRYGFMHDCIEEAFRLSLIDNEEKKRLQAINKRGNDAKHIPEYLLKREKHTPEKLSGKESEDDGNAQVESSHDGDARADVNSALPSSEMSETTTTDGRIEIGGRHSF
eukprot:Skav229477  [mRNA]  locus=scaffold4865:51126:52466:- [translate_table: standard]